MRRPDRWSRQRRRRAEVAALEGELFSARTILDDPVSPAERGQTGGQA